MQPRGRAGVLLAALQDRSERREDGPELPLRSEPPATMEWRSITTRSTNHAKRDHNYLMRDYGSNVKK